MTKNILNLNSNEARGFFLSEERYFTFDLPKYFTFNKLLKNISDELTERNLSDFYSNEKPGAFDDVNYKLFSNKDGEYAWRLFQLIHPAIYVSLVHNITRSENWQLVLDKLSEPTCVECASIPVLKSEKQKTEKGEQILTWWEAVEQKSISFSMEYNYIFHTDITACYDSIYTHSIPWALHTKELSKNKQNNKNLLGNVIDWHLQDMSNRQTNGIPQGSVLMDMIAEIVLKYADKKLSERLGAALSSKQFKIIRYRDDYRVFVKDLEVGKRIIKELSSVLADLGMRINPEKTYFSEDIISNSIKADKLFWLTNSSKNWNIEKHLLIIRELSQKYRNSGTLVKELQSFYKKIHSRKEFHNVEVLISIITDIAFKNPRTYPASVSIIGKLIASLDDKDKKEIIEKIENKFNKLPNTELIDLWLQRLTLKFDSSKEYACKLSKKIKNPNNEVWNSEWLNGKLKQIISKTSIINHSEIESMDAYPCPDEFLLFEY